MSKLSPFPAIPMLGLLVLKLKPSFPKEKGQQRLWPMHFSKCMEHVDTYQTMGVQMLSSLLCLDHFSK